MGVLDLPGVIFPIHQRPDLYIPRPAHAKGAPLICTPPLLTPLLPAAPFPARSPQVPDSPVPHKIPSGAFCNPERLGSKYADCGLGGRHQRGLLHRVAVAAAQPVMFDRV